MGEYLEFSNIKNKEDSYSRNEVLSVSSTLGVVNQLELKGRSFAGESLKGYYIVKNRDVIYAKSISSNNPYGTIRTNRIHEGVVSPLYAVFKPKENVHPEFVQVYFELDTRMNNYIFPLVNMGDRFIQVSGKDVISGNVIFPGIEEQMKISSFFDSLDQTIAFQQRELKTHYGG